MVYTPPANKPLHRWTLGLSFALLLWGCEASPDVASSAAPDALVEHAASSDWATRKLAQRQLSLLDDGAHKGQLATQLMSRAPAATSRKDTLRSVGQAYKLSPGATLAGARVMLNDGQVPLARKVSVLQVLARHVGAPQAPGEFARVAREHFDSLDVASPHWTVALQLLARFAPEQALPYIETASKGDKLARRAAAAALRVQKYPQSAALLAQLVVDPDNRVRRHALHALRAYPETATNPQLEAVLQNERNIKNCSRALEAAGARAPKDAAALLVPRLNATEACGPMHRFAILAEFRRLLRREPNLPTVRAALTDIVKQPHELAEGAYAAAALGDVALAERASDAGASEGLIMLTSASQETPAIRLAAIAALGRIGGQRGDSHAVRRLEALLARVDQPIEMQLAVIAALRAGDNMQAHNAFLLVPYTSRSEPAALRKLAVEGLADLGHGSRSAARLQTLLGDDDAAVRATSRRGLQRIATLNGVTAGDDTAASWAPLVEQLRGEHQEDKAAERAAAASPTK